jgi:hypothetical protein
MTDLDRHLLQPDLSVVRGEELVRHFIAAAASGRMDALEFGAQVTFSVVHDNSSGEGYGMVLRQRLFSALVDVTDPLLAEFAQWTPVQSLIDQVCDGLLSADGINREAAATTADIFQGAVRRAEIGETPGVSLTVEGLDQPTWDPLLITWTIALEAIFRHLVDIVGRIRVNEVVGRRLAAYDGSSDISDLGL